MGPIDHRSGCGDHGSGIASAGRRLGLSWVVAAAAAVMISRRRKTHRNDGKSAVMRFASPQGPRQAGPLSVR